MKLTKETLKQLIKEELSDIMNELMMPGSPEHKEAMAFMMDIHTPEEAQALADTLSNSIDHANQLKDSPEYASDHDYDEKIQGNLQKLRFLNDKYPELQSKFI
tara:strand:- start:223 stop:531 length:309 start_codon:yes stop_codon:yes gene_type:complete